MLSAAKLPSHTGQPCLHELTPKTVHFRHHSLACHWLLLCVPHQPLLPFACAIARLSIVDELWIGGPPMLYVVDASQLCCLWASTEPHVGCETSQVGQV